VHERVRVVRRGPEIAASTIGPLFLRRRRDAN